MSRFDGVDDLGPSDEDIERFGDDGAHEQRGYCPDCGADCWDEVEFCPTCGAQIGGRVLSKPKVKHDLQRRFTVIVALTVLITFVWIML